MDTELILTEARASLDKAKKSGIGSLSESARIDLLEIIDGTYPEPVDRITAATIKADGTIRAIAYSGDLALDITIKDDEIEVSELSVAGTDFAAQPDPIANYSATLQQSDPFTPWLTQLQSLLAESDDLDDYQTKLATAFDDLDSAEFAELMTAATTVASLNGWSDAQEE